MAYQRANHKEPNTFSSLSTLIGIEVRSPINLLRKSPQSDKREGEEEGMREIADWKEQANVALVRHLTN